MISKTSAMNLEKTPYKIQVTSRQKRIQCSPESIAAFCDAALRSIKQPPAFLSVALVGKQEIQALNLRYRRKNLATDVLSFSYEGAVMEDLPFLGEIVIAPEVAASQSAVNRTTVEKEMRKLLLHGLLHLLGYDHETDKGRMNRIQARLMRRKFFMNDPPLALWK
jgi:probable rRNA maturation factor